MPLLVVLNIIGLGAVLYFLSRIDKRLGGDASKGLQKMQEDLVKEVKDDITKVVKRTRKAQQVRGAEAIKVVRRKVKSAAQKADTVLSDITEGLQDDIAGKDNPM